MNIILVTEYEFKNGLPLSDFRTVHIVSILKLKENETFKLGIINKKEIYACVYKEGSKLEFKDIEVIKESNNLLNIKIAVGLMRPIVSKRLLKDLSSIGITEILFFTSSLSEKSYADSKLYKNEEYKKYLIDGAMQGSLTFLPKFSLKKNLKDTLTHIGNTKTKILLDQNSKKNLSNLELLEQIVVIIGPERGFTAYEVETIKESGFTSYFLSQNILRTETSVTSSAIALALKFV